MMEAGRSVRQLARSIVEGGIDKVHLVLILLACLLYVHRTYRSPIVPALQDIRSFGRDFEGPVSRVLEAFMSALLVLVFLVRLRGALVPKAFWLTPISLLDIATSIPVLFSTIMPNVVAAALCLSFHSFLIRMLRILRILRTVELVPSVWSKQPVLRQLLCIMCTTLSLTFIGSCAFPLLEAEADEEAPYDAIPLHDALYFVLVTITTVGYGDISPVSLGARYATLLMVLCTLILPQTRLHRAAPLTPLYAGRAPRRLGVPGTGATCPCTRPARAKLG